MKSRKNNKKAAVGVVFVMGILVLLFGGTYAWYATGAETNEIRGTGEIYDKDDPPSGAVLHDDFREIREDESEYDQENATHIKQVYVENTGEDALFIRVMMSEYMEIDQKSIDTADASDKSTWHVHTYQDSFGFCEDCGRLFHYYWEWEMGGDSFDYLISSDLASNVVQRYDADGADTQDLDNKLPSEKNKVNGGDSCEVITMSSYVNYSDNEKEEFNGWILDTDGYAYWAQELEPGEATGPLLNRVKQVNEINNGDEYEYIIDVSLDSADDEDVLAWIYGIDFKEDARSVEKQEEEIILATDEAASLLKSIATYDLDIIYYLRQINNAQPDPENEIYPTVIIDGDEWLVMSKGTTTAELLRAKVLSTPRSINNVNVDGSLYVPWGKANLRDYLNDDYYSEELSESFQKIIAETTLMTPEYYGSTNMDSSREKAYILSAEELERYWPTPENRRTTIAGSNSSQAYWTRTVRENSTVNAYYYAVSSSAGTFTGTNTLNNTLYIRPAVTVSLTYNYYQ